MADEPASPYERANAIFTRGLRLRRDGRDDEAIAAFGDLVARYGETRERRIADLVVMSLVQKGAALLRAGRSAAAARATDEAVAARDRFAALGAAPPEVRLTVAQALMNKAAIVWGGGSNPEVADVYADLLWHIAPAPHPALRPVLVATLLSYSTVLTNLGRDAEANALPGRTAALLAVTGNDAPNAGPGSAPADEEIAALLGETCRGECWRWFAAPDADLRRDDLAVLALDLYRRTNPVVEALADDRDLEAPATQAAFLVRSIADGCAMLSRPGPVAPADRALLPVRSRAEHGIRALGLDRWADDLGRPLGLPEGDDDLDALIPHEPSAGGVDGFPDAFVKAIRTGDLIAVARRSPFASDLLHDDAVRARAAGTVARAVNWAAWIGRRRPEATPAALAMLFLAQGFYIATCTPAPLQDWFPSRALVRGALDESDARDWFDEAGVVLPDWLA